MKRERKQTYDRRWQKQRRQHLRENPLCVICASNGYLTPAEVVDHVEPHRGDKNAFRLGKLQSLCKLCHDKSKQQVEKNGFYTQIGPDGFPVDRNHPVYQIREPEHHRGPNGVKVHLE